MSSDFMLAEGLGFPYPAFADMRPHGTVAFTFVEGRGAVSLPVLRYSYAEGAGHVYEPALDRLMERKFSDDDAIYLRRIYELKSKLPNLIFAGSDTQLEVIGNPTLSWRPRRLYAADSHDHVFTRQTLVIQNELLQFVRVSHSPTASDYAACRTINDLQIAAIDGRRQR